VKSRFIIQRQAAAARKRRNIADRIRTGIFFRLKHCAIILNSIAKKTADVESRRSALQTWPALVTPSALAEQMIERYWRTS